MLGCPIINSPLLGFPHGSAVWGSGVVAAVTLVMAMAQVCSLPRELLRALGAAQINTYVKIKSLFSKSRGTSFSLRHPRIRYGFLSLSVIAAPADFERSDVIVTDHHALPLLTG